jgi:hypothetical protein
MPSTQIMPRLSLPGLLFAVIVMTACSEKEAPPVAPLLRQSPL